MLRSYTMIPFKKRQVWSRRVNEKKNTIIIFGCFIPKLNCIVRPSFMYLKNLKLFIHFQLVLSPYSIGTYGVAFRQY